ncbi:MAG: asparaginase [Chloroflexota bacterium]|nr:asparaginase [Chloroflexota bacterium]
MSTLLVEVTRVDRVESTHQGSIAVVDSTGGVIASAGDPDRFLYFRSSAKPFQAIPVVESGAADRYGFTPAELALCCASHAGSIQHQEQVAAALAKLGLDEHALQCGISGPADEQAHAAIELGERPKTQLTCDCSGKHTGMLATCLHLGLPIDTYLDPAHPLQVTIKGLIAEACGLSPSELHMGIDGCSLPTFGATLAHFARAFAELARPTRHEAALNRLRSAMIAHPFNVAGEGDEVTTLMRAGNGDIVAKSGAEGLICIGVPSRGLGIAIRIDDGSFRSHAVVAVEALRQLDAAPASVLEQITAVHRPEIRTHNGRAVGEMRPAFTLS